MSDDQEPGGEGDRSAGPRPLPGGVDLASAIGGRRGLIDSGVPGALFVAVFTLNGHQLRPALWAAVGLAGLLTLLRLVRREPLQQAVAGLVGVGIAAWFAARTGEARDYFLPGFLLNAAYVVGYAVSALVRWPLVGVVIGPLLGEGLGWRRDPPRLRAYTLATWLFAAMFALRLAVQVPLYLVDQLLALGTVKVLMGAPLFALVAWLSYLVIRSAPPPHQHLGGHLDTDGEAEPPGGS